MATQTLTRELAGPAKVILMQQSDVEKDQIKQGGRQDIGKTPGVGVTLDDFQILDVDGGRSLGKGSFGVVRRVRRQDTLEIFALKTMNKVEVIEGDLIEQVEREIQVQQSLKHENVLCLFQHFEDTDSVFLLLEYCAKGELYQLLRTRKGRRFPEHVARHYFLQVARGLQYLHSLQIIHRDLKPENLLVNHDDVLKIADFGWCAQATGPRTTFCGTLDYLAPEMVQMTGHDHNLDIWSLGVLLYEMVVGRPPFQCTNHTMLVTKILRVDYAFPAFVPHDIVDLVQRILRKECWTRLPIPQILRSPWVLSTRVEPATPAVANRAVNAALITSTPTLQMPLDPSRVSSADLERPSAQAQAMPMSMAKGLMHQALVPGPTPTEPPEAPRPCSRQLLLGALEVSYEGEEEDEVARTRPVSARAPPSWSASAPSPVVTYVPGGQAGHPSTGLLGAVGTLQPMASSHSVPVQGPTLWAIGPQGMLVQLPSAVAPAGAAPPGRVPHPPTSAPALTLQDIRGRPQYPAFAGMSSSVQAPPGRQAAPRSAGAQSMAALPSTMGQTARRLPQGPVPTQPNFATYAQARQPAPSPPPAKLIAPATCVPSHRPVAGQPGAPVLRPATRSLSPVAAVQRAAGAPRYLAGPPNVQLPGRPSQVPTAVQL